MEDRHIIAYALGAAMVLFIVFVMVRYVNNRRQFKLRQLGRGKSTTNITSVPAE
jgi:cytochrome c biogenesis protein CcdA